MRRKLVFLKSKVYHSVGYLNLNLIRGQEVPKMNKVQTNCNKFRHSVQDWRDGKTNIHEKLVL